MKDPIIHKINTHRDDFDKDRPDEKIWENIHRELHPVKRKSFLWLKLAAVFVLTLGTLWLFDTEDKFNAGITATLPTAEKDSTETGTQKYIFKRRVIRGGSWNNAGYFLESQDRKLADNVTSEIQMRGILSASNNKQYYMEQTEMIVNAEVLCNGSATTLYNFNHDLNPDAPYNCVQDFTWDFGDTVRSVLQSEPEYPVGYYYEQYDEFEENKFVASLDESVSTFSIDVDAAGYSNVRRFITEGFLPPKNAVKLEEMVNYFKYDLPEPDGKHPFSITTELGNCPWNKEHRLLQIAIKGKSIPQEDYPASNLVFLIDVSGSMEDANKLPLLKKGFKMLVSQLREEDRVAIVVYAGNAGLVLPSTSGANKEKILEALDNLSAGGSTAGGEGIQLAYTIAQKNFIKNGNNRIVLATDGDFNVGVSDDASLVRMVEEKRKSGVFLSVLAFGEGNLQSSKMEKIADNGNGNYSYIDNVLEAKKVLVTEMGATLHTIAKDVKLQLEFNPKTVESYRLLGYENRMLATEDFDNDLKDAGDLGSGHTIVALYEIVPAKATTEASKSTLKYQKMFLADDEELAGELVTIKFRYKKPDESKSNLMSVVVKNRVDEDPSDNFLFASAVAEFGLLIRDSEYKADADFKNLIKRARVSKGKDVNGYRAEFIQLAEMGQILVEEYKAKKKQ